MVRQAISLILALVICLFAVTAPCAREPADEPAPSAEDAIPFKTRPDTTTSASARVVWVTLLAIGLALGGALLLRRYLQQKGWMPQDKTDRLTVDSVRRVSPKLTIYLISVDAKEYLVTQSGNQTSIIEHHGSADEPT